MILGREDFLEKEMQPSPVFWKVPGTKEPGGLQSMESQRVGHTELLLFFTVMLIFVPWYEICLFYTDCKTF